MELGSIHVIITAFFGKIIMLETMSSGQHSSYFVCLFVFCPSSIDHKYSITIVAALLKQ